MTQHVHNDNDWDVVFPTLDPPVTVEAHSDGELPDTVPAHSRDEDGNLVEEEVALELPTGVHAVDPSDPAAVAKAAELAAAAAQAEADAKAAEEAAAAAEAAAKNADNPPADPAATA